MFFNSYTSSQLEERNLIDSFYFKIVNVSRNRAFYDDLLVPDTIDGRFDLLVLFSIFLTYYLSRCGSKGRELSQNLFDKIFLDLDLSLRELGAGDAGVHIKIKNMIKSYMGRQKVYCESFENNNFKKLENHIIKNIYRNTTHYNDEPKSLVKYCKFCIHEFDKKNIEYFSSKKFNFPKIDNFFD